VKPLFLSISDPCFHQNQNATLTFLEMPPKRKAPPPPNYRAPEPPVLDMRIFSNEELVEIYEAKIAALENEIEELKRDVQIRDNRIDALHVEISDQARVMEQRMRWTLSEPVKRS
jgi:hypothetical protein